MFCVFARADLADSDLSFKDSCFLFTEDVFLMSSKDPKNPVIYAVFTTSRYRSFHGELHGVPEQAPTLK